MVQAEQILHDHYQLKKKLGHNAGRQTWLAEDLATPTKELVVVKLLTFGGDVHWDDLKLFEREAQVLKQLNHPRIPKYRDYFSIDDRTLWFGLVQEYIPGDSLKDQLTQGRKFSAQEVRKLAIEVLNILIYLHELNPALLHRDIKPSNLIWGEDNQIYLVDFGAVQDRAAAEGATFTVVGTYGYAPLEQFGGRAVPASDLYALGATLIHLLTGIAPADLPQKDLRIQFKDKITINSNFVDWLEQLTEPALEKRFSTAREVLMALKVRKATNEGKSERISSATSFLPADICKPSNTRVVVKKSSGSLEIMMPTQGISGLKLLKFFVILTIFLSCLAWMNYLLLMIYLYIPFWLKVIIQVISPSLVVLAIIREFFESTRVAFETNSRYFVVEWRWLGHKVFSRKGNLSEIIYTYCKVKGNISQVFLREKTGKQYSFGRQLSEVECAWLAQEIQTWLNFK
ncbi:serine/threonine protein kinase [Microcoleus sp. FACHB-672]|uniref:serine/threonine protein kinase n=1 Tax=Microcoleus sp. FACHB-672 TaxID=2692825 RepID=UPI001683D441|nr:serine/threonine-protein kinase [Microcoleus sp. FACHB-672]MBD2042347.1 serine/threonine protein kinase [Microcoleus sp. FACHB-672]